MSEIEKDREGVSRRTMLLGLGAAAGAAAAVTALPTTVNAAPSVLPAWSPAVPQAVGAAIPGLSYIGIDAQSFFPAGNPSMRLYEDLTGSKIDPQGVLFAGLSLPAGSSIHQINVGYQKKPTLLIDKRTLQQPALNAAPEHVLIFLLPESPGGPFSSTINLSSPITIDRESTYTIGVVVEPGDAVFGCSIGYLPPTQSFIPFTGSEPRVLDTRNPGPLTGKLGPGEERVVDLGFVGARSAVINLTVTETVGGGFVAVFQNGINWPENSSINWSSTNQNIANGVITAVDANGRIKIRGGANPTHVVIDRIGFMI
jgi:hypothetical protein